ncbi:MAG: hypothetical protein NTY90_00005, partial [Candidatus Micrarchaeota archaeon]|nr:hypothetical protein [Candidatus Micrarchaeota archaeon]
KTDACCGVSCDLGYKCSGGACAAAFCNISNAYWSVYGPVPGGTRVSMTASAFGACNGKTATFEVWEDDWPAKSDFITRKTAAFSGNTATAAWTAAYLGDQWGNPEFYFKATANGTTAKSSTLRVSEGTGITFASFQSAFFGVPIVIVTPASMGSDLSNYVNELRSAIADKTGITPTVISPPVAADDCDMYSELENAAAIVVGTPADNKALACAPYPLDFENEMIIQDNPWSDGKKLIWLNATDEWYDGVIALQKMFQYGVNENWNFIDGAVACLWNGKFEGHTTAEISCNVIPVIELVPDARDSWNCYKEIRNLKSLWNVTVEQLVTDAVCSLTYGTAVYDVFGTVADLSVLGGIAEIAGDITFSSLKANLKEAIRKLPKAVSEKAVATMRLIRPSMKKVYGIVKEAPAVSKELVEEFAKLFSHGDKVAANAVEYMHARRAVGWDALEVNGIGYLEKFNAEDLVIHNVEVGNRNVKAMARYFANDAMSGSMRTAKASLSIGDGYVDNIRFVNKFGDSGERLAEYAPGDKRITVITENIFKDSERLSDEAFEEMMKHYTIFHEYGHVKSVERFGKDWLQWPSAANAVVGNSGFGEYVAELYPYKALSKEAKTRFVHNGKKYFDLYYEGSDEFVLGQVRETVRTNSLSHLASIRASLDLFNDPAKAALQKARIDDSILQVLKEKGYSPERAGDLVKSLDEFTELMKTNAKTLVDDSTITKNSVPFYSIMNEIKDKVGELDLGYASLAPPSPTLLFSDEQKNFFVTELPFSLSNDTFSAPPQQVIKTVDFLSQTDYVINAVIPPNASAIDTYLSFNGMPGSCQTKAIGLEPGYRSGEFSGSLVLSASALPARSFTLDDAMTVGDFEFQLYKFSAGDVRMEIRSDDSDKPSREIIASTSIPSEKI